MNVLTIIPARAGSVGVPGKNVRTVYGKPLIAWTIECAVATRGLDAIIVTSDDEKALAVARAYPRVTARLRPSKLAQDGTPIVAVIEHVLAEEEGERDLRFDAVLLLQPTAPLRDPAHVEEALAALTGEVNSVISVCETGDAHPARMYSMAAGQVLAPLMPDLEHLRRQDITPAFLRNGSIYIVRRDAFENQRAVMAKPARGFVMDSRYHLNIDENRDMVIAEALIAAWQEGRL